MVNGIITNPLFFILASLMGWIFIKEIANLCGYKNKILKYIGNATMPIMLFHFLCFKLVSIAYLWIAKKPLFLLASFPVLSDVPKYLWIFYTIIGVCVPLVINSIYLKLNK